LKPRILHAEADGWAAAARQRLEEVAEVEAASLDRPALLARLATVDALIVRLGHQVDEELLAAAPRLRFVASATTGLDHVDLVAAARRGVAVLSLRGESDFLDQVPATAEFTWALLLALLRRLPWAAADAARGNWRRELFRGRELAGRKLGLVGLGRVGRQVAGFGLAFGMEVAACDPAPARLVPGVELYDSLEALLARSEVLCLHAPLDDSTRGLIGERELALLPSGAYLVNTARGGLVDEEALVAALANGRLAGAALDVIENERDEEARRAGPIQRFLREAGGDGRLLLTPHLGGATFDSMARTEIFIADKLAQALERESP
jgi:D-3-phosphoglycerate dehydrogenase / 2-oxoglutarate reductase